LENTPLRGQIKSVDKAVDILQVLAPEKDGLQLNEIARRLQINTSTAHHLLDTLKQRGFVDQQKQTGAYLLGYHFISLALQFLSKMDLFSASIDPLRDLRDRSGETSYLTVLKGLDCTSLIELPGTKPLQARRGGPSEQSSLHATASSKLLLAYLPVEQSLALLSSSSLTPFTPNTITNLENLQRELVAIRQQGYALDREEHLPGVSCIAAPIFNYQGECVATASISYPTSATERNQELLELVIDAGRTISRNLGCGYGYLSDLTKDQGEIAPVVLT
jgi:DNA-binding IclR family transcriptional regulator